MELCIEAGLVDGEELYFDATKVEANAALHSLRRLLSPAAAREHIEKVFEENAREDDGPQPASPPEDRDEGGTAKAEPQEARNTSVFRRLLETYRHARRSSLRRNNWYVRLSDRYVSRTDPDARPMKTPGSRSKLGYHSQYVVDGGKARIILATLVTSAAVMENSPMLDLVRWLRFRWHLRPKQATGDTTYATLENIKGLEDDGVKAYMPLPNRSGRTGFYGQEKFTYLPERDIYVCPQGQDLAKVWATYTENAYTYRARPQVCNACPLKSSCTESAKGRTIQRPFDQEYIERVRRYHETAACRSAISKRKVWIEPLFAEAKTLHGLRRFHLRGIEKVNIEGLMIAAGQNLKRLLRQRGTRPSPLASFASLPIRLRSLFSRPAAIHHSISTAISS